MEKSKKVLVLYSGGLDSRLVVHLLQEQDFEVETIYFELPFGCGCCNLDCNFNFTQLEGVKMTIFEVNKEPLLSEYLNILKNPKYGTGAGINPCRDCKVFMFKKAKEYADKNNIEIIASGEVLGQRPMSQVLKSMKIIDEAISFEILRPLSAKLLPETSYEKRGLINRNKLLDISGRSRKKQMALAEKYGIKYPSPGGGCFLCEKEPSRRLNHLLKINLINEKTLPLTMIGRHFFIDDVWFVVARNENESLVINNFEMVLGDEKGKPSVYFSSDSGKRNAMDLQDAYSTGADDGERQKFKEFKL